MVTTPTPRTLSFSYFLSRLPRDQSINQSCFTCLMQWRIQDLLKGGQMRGPGALLLFKGKY